MRGKERANTDLVASRVYVERPSSRTKSRRFAVSKQQTLGCIPHVMHASYRDEAVGVHPAQGDAAISWAAAARSSHRYQQCPKTNIQDCIGMPVSVCLILTRWRGVFITCVCNQVSVTGTTFSSHLACSPRSFVPLHSPDDLKRSTAPGLQCLAARSAVRHFSNPFCFLPCLVLRAQQLSKACSPQRSVGWGCATMEVLNTVSHERTKL